MTIRCFLWVDYFAFAHTTASLRSDLTCKYIGLELWGNTNSKYSRERCSEKRAVKWHGKVMRNRSGGVIVADTGSVALLGPHSQNAHVKVPAYLYRYSYLLPKHVSRSLFFAKGQDTMSDEGPTCSLLGQNDWHTRPKSSDRHWWNEPRNGYQIAYGRDSEDAPYLRAGCGCSAAYTESSINMTDSFRLFLTREVTLHPVSDIQCIRAYMPNIEVYGTNQLRGCHLC